MLLRISTTKNFKEYLTDVNYDTSQIMYSEFQKTIIMMEY
jgi:hypothetical protein